MRVRFTIAGWLVLLLAGTGCVQDKSGFLDELSSFRVEITSGNPGSEGTPLDFSSTGTPFTLSVTALNGRGEEMAFDGLLRVSAEPGVVSPETLSVSGGQGSGTFDLSLAFGKSRIWVEDKGSIKEPGTFATGVTETLWFKNPHVRDIQESTTTTTSPFEGQRITVTDGTMVVTEVTHEGFYITDTDDTEWNSVYMFTFSRPDDIVRGDTLSRLSGTVDEFLGFTEMQNPAFTVSGSGVVPPPTVLDCNTDVLAGGLAMERYEAGLVEVADADIEVCPSFPSCPDYDQYQQWTVQLPCGARLNVVSNFSLPDLDPEINQGQTLSILRGTLRHVQFANPQWIFEPRDEGDICCPSCVPSMTDGC